MSIEDLFAGMATATMSGGGNYMTPGQYVVEVVNIRLKSGYKGRSFIFEFRIVESNNPNHPVGSSGSYVILLDNPDPKKRGYAFGDMKAVFFALDGKDPKKVKDPAVDPQAHEEAVELSKLALQEDYCKEKGLEPGFLSGTRVKLECRTKKTNPSPQKPQGGEFTVHDWSPVAAGEAAA
jgi:hypothetical protein